MHRRPERRMVVRAYLTVPALEALDAEARRRAEALGCPVSRPQVVAQIIAEWAERLRRREARA